MTIRERVAMAWLLLLSAAMVIGGLFLAYDLFGWPGMLAPYGAMFACYATWWSWKVLELN